MITLRQDGILKVLEGWFLLKRFCAKQRNSVELSFAERIGNSSVMNGDIAPDIIILESPLCYNFLMDDYKQKLMIS